MEAAHLHRSDGTTRSARGRCWPLSLTLLSLACLVVCAGCAVKVGGKAQAGAPTATSAPSSNRANPTPDAQEIVFRMRPVLQGPVPPSATPGGGSAGPALPSPTSATVTLDQAAAQFATLTCDSNGAAPSEDQAEDFLAACSQDLQTKYLLGPAILNGTDVTDAVATTQQTTGEWVVLLTFSSAAQNTWAGYTAANIGKMIAFTVGGRVISSPTIQSAIQGKTQLTGNFTEAGAKRLAKDLGGH